MRTEKIKSFVVGKEAKVNKDGQPYGLVTIMDGASTLNLVTKDHNLFERIQVFKPCVAVLDVTWGKYPKLSIVSLENCEE